MYAIYVENLTKRYGAEEVLKGVNLRIKEGEFYALMGPNGSGKTTLVSIIASVSTPTSGKVEIYGRPPELMKELIAYIPQENFSSLLLTGRENLMYFARLLGYSKSDAEKIVDKMLKNAGLSKDADKRVANYSGGMRKKLELMTAFFPDTKILILDEPTTGLDPSARRELFGLIQEMKRDVTILLVTHIGTDAELASRVGLMNKGKIVAEGSPEELKKMSGIKNVINVETLTKTEKVKNVLTKLSEKGMLETDVGYRIYCNDAEKILPEIVRELDRVGCKVTKIEAVKPSLEDVFFKLVGKEIEGGEVK